MKKNRWNDRNDQKQGSAMVTSLVMLSLAGVTAGIILTGSISYARISAASNNMEKAAFLADAGIVAGMADLNQGGAGRISLGQSKAYFSDTSGFEGYDWGFDTHIQTVDGTNVLISVGTYALADQQVEQSIILGAGERSIHALYSHACFIGNDGAASNYVFEVGGTGSGADFIKGDVYSAGDITVSGDASLRLPEILHETVYDGIYDSTQETYDDAYTSTVFSNPVSQVEFDNYVALMNPYIDKFYGNGRYDYGEAFVDTIGNGVYDEGEPFEDRDGDGERDSGDGYEDVDGDGYYNAECDTMIDNGNGEWDEGEEWTEDSSHSQRRNGRYDPEGGYWKYKNGSWSWKTSYTSGRRWWKRTYSCASWPAEEFEDVGDSNFDPGEAYVDQNGVYDPGEAYLDDRNGVYDYGTQAHGIISGMPQPQTGQRASTGFDALIQPPDLEHMYYEVSKESSSEPAFALQRWGNDVAVTVADYNGYAAITDASKPEHIFLCNPPKNGSEYVNGKQIKPRSYNTVYDINGQAIDDFFLEDPTDSTYNSRDSSASIDGTSYTSPMYVNVTQADNNKLYYVEGNLYIHSPTAYCMRFREPGTKITIVAKGNITISDEFYYNADYDPNLTRSDMDSTIVKGAKDVLCLIALKNTECVDSGNIYIGDAQYGTGGSIHAMLYAENNFVDNNLDTSGQPFISIYGNMSAGNQVQINRSGSARTRLDITLDDRIRLGEVIVPGLPHPVGGERAIRIDSAWTRVPGSWKSWSMLN